MFDVVTCFDFIEHVPRALTTDGNTRNCFIQLMNEIYRVLKPGGFFIHATPAFPSVEAFMDPTHVTIITDEAFPRYFCLPNNYARVLRYGSDGEFVIIDQRSFRDFKLIGLMRASKQI